MTLMELMEYEVRKAGKPLTVGDALALAWQDGKIEELPHVGKTPQNTLNSLLHKDIAKGDSSRFIQISAKPALFDVRNR